MVSMEPHAGVRKPVREASFSQRYTPGYDTFEAVLRTFSTTARTGLALSVGAILAAAAAAAAVAVLPSRHGSTPSPTTTKLQRAGTSLRTATKWLADDAYLYGCEAHEREYDDRPVCISRAAVYRRGHDETPLETLFDFKRDDLYCLPHSVGFLDGIPGWYCVRPVLDGGREDPSCIVLSHHGSLQRVSAPDASSGSVVTAGCVMFVLRRRQHQSLVRIDAFTGQRDDGAPLPEPYASASLRLVGTRENTLFGTLEHQEHGASLWSIQSVMDPQPEVLLQLPAKAQLSVTTMDPSGIYLSWRAPAREGLPALTHVQHFVHGSPRSLFVTETHVDHLLVRAPWLYYVKGGCIERFHLASGRTELLVPSARVSYGARKLAVGGNWLYWASPDGVMRVPLPAAHG